MLPIWLTPKLMKLGALGAIILAIFLAGFFTKGKLTAAKIERMRVKVQTVEYNYDLCLTDVERAIENYTTLKTTSERANAEVEALNAAHQERVRQMRLAGRAAINQLNALHDEAIRDMITETDDLRGRMAAMSAAEACNLAMQEIVK